MNLPELLQGPGEGLRRRCKVFFTLHSLTPRSLVSFVMKSIIFFIMSGLLLTFTFPGDNVWSAQNEVKQVILRVDGMTCASCPATVKMALKRLEGVVGVEVSYRDAKATVNYKEGKVTIDDMIKSIDDIGYRASIFEHK